jgi:F0F1-type ATP synthase membrane subunit c/vacuolar-type H+-ATPase subunit K
MIDDKTAGRIFSRGVSHEIRKTAELELSDVEGNLGFYLPDRFERPVRDLIESHVAAKPILSQPLKETGKYTGVGAGIGVAAGAGLAALARKPKLFSSILGGLAGAVGGAVTAGASKAVAEGKASKDIVSRLRRHPEIAPLAEAREQLDHDRRVEMLPLLEQQEKSKRQMSMMNTFIAGMQERDRMLMEQRDAMRKADKKKGK